MIDINPGILLVQIITFLAALFIVWKIAWGPIVAMMKKREEDIRKDIEDAGKARETAEALKKEYESGLAKSQADAQRLLSRAAEEGDDRKREIVKIANTEAERIISEAKEELNEEKKRLMKELRGDVVDIAVKISEKLMHEKMGKSTREKLLKNSLSAVSRSGRGIKH